MNRAVSLILATAILLLMPACNQTADNNISNNDPGGSPHIENLSNTENQPDNVPSNVDNPAESPKILIAYFSRTGNTKTIAEHIQASTQGDLFEIKTTETYPEDYSACLAQASEELSADFRPELSSYVSGMDDYGMVFIGYPIWHGDTPMTIRSFLEEYELSGKTIVPFCTSGGSGISQSVTAIRKLCPDSTVLEGICINNSDSDDAYEKIEEWISSLGIILENQSSEKEESEHGGIENSMENISITVGNSRFSAKLCDNEAARAFSAKLPLTLNMSELNGNEKFYNLPDSLPTDTERVGSIKAGDLMLYGTDCLVLFYESFSTPYSYTRLGHIEDASGLAAVLGSGRANVTFEISN